MSFKKELMSMGRRLNKISLSECPPTLKMVVANEAKGETLPEVEDRNPWSLYLTIEKQPQDWGK